MKVSDVNKALYKQLFKQLCSMGLMAGEKKIIKGQVLQSSGFMDLLIEPLGGWHDDSLRSGQVYSFAHYYKHNGDGMRDPEVRFGINFRTGNVYPLVLRNDAKGIHVDSWSDESLDMDKEKEVGDFLMIWLKNIRSQGFVDAILAAEKIKRLSKASPVF